MKINFELLVVLCDLYKAVPVRTPKRLDIILQFANIITESGLSCTRNVIIDLHDEEKMFQNSPFNLTMHELARLEQNIPKLKLMTQNRINAPLILLPSVHFCCDKILKINSSYADVKVYSNDGLYRARSYHSKCKKCGCTYYHGFQESKSIGSRTFFNVELEIFNFNSSAAYTIALMKMVDNMICIGGVSFEKAADIVFESGNLSERINPDRLETAWFIYRIVEFNKDFKSWPRKSSTKELDVEELCMLVYSDIKETIDSIWLSHVCSEPA